MRMAPRDVYVGMFGHMFVELSGMNYEGPFLDYVCHFDFSKAPLPPLHTACELECKTLSYGPISVPATMLPTTMITYLMN